MRSSHPITLFSLHSSYLVLSHVPTPIQGFFILPLVKGLASLLHPLLGLAYLTVAAEGLRHREDALSILEQRQRQRQHSSSVPTQQSPRSSHQLRPWTQSEFARACAYGLIGPHSPSIQEKPPSPTACSALFLLSILSVTPRPLLLLYLCILSRALQWVPWVETTSVVNDFSSRLTRTIHGLAQSKSLLPSAFALQSLYHLPLPTSHDPSIPLGKVDEAIQIEEEREEEAISIPPPPPCPTPIIPLSPISSRASSEDTGYFSGESSIHSGETSIQSGDSSTLSTSIHPDKDARDRERKRLKKKRQHEKKKQATQTVPSPVLPSSPPSSPILGEGRSKTKALPKSSQVLEKRAGSRANRNRRRAASTAH
ncbi:hypothetical protein BJ684DRAFT_18468 [Piptocephalis cylindrospora]|uniref:Uncharacterized protein n=1 Tax=Piptocephalis cylindrospora TaxID=1907219 RepID=A0A4P9Y836_9FUNG|nr:hypothetical protein BJ684DRAFT_18468 [Piptocephalis cylindrospora]|eukprot:RKP15175.1 hypothetical protein BJ684DRAFT_18468 [Piptocephalis cylindrospora]